jgi:hypothetical protein
MVSYIRGNDNFDSTYTNGMVGSPKVWVNWNGAATVSIRNSANVTSITDQGTGNWTVNFSTAMNVAGYSAAASASQSNLNDGGRDRYVAVATFSTTGCRCNVASGNEVVRDCTYNGLITVS